LIFSTLFIIFFGMICAYSNGIDMEKTEILQKLLDWELHPETRVAIERELQHREKEKTASLDDEAAFKNILFSKAA